MNRSAPKKFFFFFFPFLICSVLWCIFFLLFEHYTKEIGSTLSALMQPQATIGQVTISPFKGIKIKNFAFHDSSLGQDFLLKEADLKCSLLGLLKKELILKEVNLEHLVVSRPISPALFSVDQLLELMKEKPKPAYEGFKVVFDQAAFCFHNSEVNFLDVNQKNQSKSLVFDLCLDIREKKAGCTGRINMEKSSWFHTGRAKNAPELRDIEFSLDVNPIGTDILVNQVKVSSAPYVLSGTGIIKDAAKRAKFDISFNMDPVRLDSIAFLKRFHPQGSDISMTGHLAGPQDNLQLRSEWIVPTAELLFEGEKLKLDRVRGQVNYNFKDNSVNIQEASGLMDGDLRIGVGGRIENVSAPVFDIRYALAKLHALQEFSSRPDDWVITLKGRCEKDKLSADINLIPNETNQPRQHMFALKNVAFASLESGNFEIYSDHLEFLEKQPGSQSKESTAQTLGFDNVKAKIRLIGKKTFVDSLTMDGYGGKVSLKGKVHFRQRKNDYVFLLKLDQLHLANIKLFYPVYSEISGVFNGQIVLEDKGGLTTKGYLWADDFEVSKLGPLDKIADFIGIDSIKEISHSKVALDFDLSEKNSIIERFDLDGEGIAMRSRFNINDQKWFEGNVALSLPRKVLEEAKMFKTLLSIAKERENLLDFVVHVSGFSDSLRTELVKSDFRDKLKDRLGSGTQQMIEKTVEKAIDSLE